MMRFCLILNLLVFSSCNLLINESTIIGTYVFNNDDHTTDTLIIYENHTYEKNLYSKTTKIHHFVSGTWNFKSERITLKDFLPNGNGKFLSKSYEDGLITSSLPVKYIDGSVAIVEYGEDLYYYRKL